MSAFDLKRTLILRMIDYKPWVRSVLSSAVWYALIVATPALADDDQLIGVWIADGRASEAIYGKFTITDTHISWPRTNNLRSCTTTYEIVSTETGDTFLGEFPTHVRSVKDRLYRTVTVKIAVEKCPSGSFRRPSPLLQFSFPSDRPDFAYVVERDNAGKPHSELAFRKSR